MMEAVTGTDTMRHSSAASILRAAPAVAVIALMLVAAGAAPASAQDGPGMRAGLSVNPDQFFVGGHYVSQPVTGMLRFQPNVEAGFGQNVTAIAFNGEFALWKKVDPDWHVYFGGGPSMNVYRYTLRDTTETGLGFNVVAGLRRRGGVFFELKYGVGDSPGFKMAVGYTIR
jgi:hypothetical protein